MYAALIIAGSVAILAAGWIALSRTGFSRRAIPLIVLALAGVELIVLGIFAWPHAARTPALVVTAAPAPSPAPTAPRPTPVTVDRSCNGLGAAVPASDSGGNQDLSLPVSGAADVQRLPTAGFTVVGPPIAGGPLLGPFVLPSEIYARNDPTVRYDMDVALGPTMADLNFAQYKLDVSSQSPLPDLQLMVGTPKPGTCWNLLAVTALKSLILGQVGAIATEKPGPRLAAYHVTMACANGMVIGGAYVACAWAGPGIDRHHPLFGLVYIPPSISVFVESGMVTFADRVFATMLR